MIPPFTKASTAQLVHVLHGPVAIVMTFFVLALVMFLIGFATAQSLAEKPKLRAVQPARVIPWPTAEEKTPASQQR